MASRWTKPVIQSDNGSGYIAREFRLVLKENGLGHHRIKPHCPEENGMMERANRTLRERLEEEELTNLLQAKEVLAKVIRWYNEERLHSALGYLPPVEYYRGQPENPPRRKATKDGGSPAPAEGKEPGVEAANNPLCGGATCLITPTRFVPLGVKQITCHLYGPSSPHELHGRWFLH